MQRMGLPLLDQDPEMAGSRFGQGAGLGGHQIPLLREIGHQIIVKARSIARESWCWIAERIQDRVLAHGPLSGDECTELV